MPPPSTRLGRFVRRDKAVLQGAFAPTEAFLSPAGFVQGGILAAMLDEAMSPVVAATSGEAVFVQALEMKRSSCAAPDLARSLGRDAGGTSRPRRHFLEGRLRDPQRNIIAAATAMARLVRPGR